MNHFGRALKLAFRHRWNVVGCLLTSLAVAVLWGGNLTAVWPVVDVIMNDSSLPEWVDQQIAAQRQRGRRLEALARGAQRALEGRCRCRRGPQCKAKSRSGKQAIEKIIASAPEKGAWSDARIAERTRQLNTLKRLEELRTASPRNCRRNLPRKKRQPRRRSSSMKKRAARYRWIAPYAHRWLPTTPFDTLVLVCVFVLVATLFKSIFKVWNSILVSRIGQSGVARFAERLLPPDSAARHGPLHRARPRRLDEPLHRRPGLRGPGRAARVWAGGARTLEDGRLPGHRGLGQLATACCSRSSSRRWPATRFTGSAKRSSGLTSRRCRKLSSIFETLSETLGGIKLIKAFTMEAERAATNFTRPRRSSSAGR